MILKHNFKCLLCFFFVMYFFYNSNFNLRQIVFVFFYMLFKAAMLLLVASLFIINRVRKKKKNYYYFLFFFLLFFSFTFKMDVIFFWQLKFTKQFFRQFFDFNSLCYCCGFNVCCYVKCVECVRVFPWVCVKGGHTLMRAKL